MNIIENLEKEQMRLDIPDFKAGDTIKVHARIKEGIRNESKSFKVQSYAEEKGLQGRPLRFGKFRTALAWKGFFPYIHPQLIRLKSFPGAR